MTTTDDVIENGIEDEEIDDVDAPDDDGDDEYVPPSKEDHAAMVAALEKANGEAKARRLELRELRKQQGTPAGDPSKDGQPVDEARLRLAIESETIGTWKPLVVRSAASAALTAAGVIGTPDRLLKLIDMDDVDVDPVTGKIDGVEEAVADLKKDYPHLFRRKAGSRSLNAADRKGGGTRTEKMTDSQIQAAQLRGEL